MKVRIAGFSPSVGSAETESVFGAYSPYGEQENSAVAMLEPSEDEQEQQELKEKQRDIADKIPQIKQTQAEAIDRQIPQQIQGKAEAVASMGRLDANAIHEAQQEIQHATAVEAHVNHQKMGEVALGAALAGSIASIGGAQLAAIEALGQAVRSDPRIMGGMRSIFMPVDTLETSVDGTRLASDRGLEVGDIKDENKLMNFVAMETPRLTSMGIDRGLT